MFVGELLAYKGRFKDAARAYQRCQQEHKALAMYTDLRMFDLAQVSCKKLSCYFRSCRYFICVCFKVSTGHNDRNQFDFSYWIPRKFGPHTLWFHQKIAHCMSQNTVLATFLLRLSISRLRFNYQVNYKYQSRFYPI